MLLTEIITNAHMAGQNHAGCKHPSWGDALGHTHTIVTDTIERAARQFLEESPVNNTQQTQPAISQLYSQWCSEKNVAGGVRSYVKDFVAWVEKQQAGA